MIPVILGNLASGTEVAIRSSSSVSFGYAKLALLSLSGCFLGRELANLVRKYIVHRITTNSERDMASKLVNCGIEGVRRSDRFQETGIMDCLKLRFDDTPKKLRALRPSGFSSPR